MVLGVLDPYPHLSKKQLGFLEGKLQQVNVQHN